MSDSALAGAQPSPHHYDPEATVADFSEKVILKPAEVEHLWNSEDPKKLMVDYVMRIVREKIGRHGSEWNRHSPFEQRWEKAECTMIGEFCLQALVFARGEAKISDSLTVGSIVNAFYDILMPFDAGQGLRLEHRTGILQDVLRNLFLSKRLSKEQVKAVLDFAQRTAFKHLALIDLCFSKKRVFVEKTVRVTLAEPKIMGNLQTGCRELFDDREDLSKSQQDFYQEEEPAGDDTHAGTQDGAEEGDGQAEVDPEDPLYGLDQRLKNMNLDDESRRIIKEKLEEASQKVKLAIEERQKNLDGKLAGGSGSSTTKRK